MLLPRRQLFRLVTVMSRQEDSALVRVIRGVLHEWDATLSVAAAVICAVILFGSDRVLDPMQAPFAALAAMGAATGSAAFVAGRWISDRLSKDEYGAVIAAFDPTEKQTQRPYFVMSLVGLFTALTGILLAVSSRELPVGIGKASYSVALGLALYCVLGSVSLVIVSRRHQMRATVLRALKEDAARTERERKRASGGLGQSGAEDVEKQ